MPDTESIHFVAQLKIEKVVKTENRDLRNGQTPGTKRDVVETINLTFKGQSMEVLKTKMASHLAVMDEDDLL